MRAYWLPWRQIASPWHMLPNGLHTHKLWPRRFLVTFESDIFFNSDWYSFVVVTERLEHANNWQQKIGTSTEEGSKLWWRKRRAWSPRSITGGQKSGIARWLRWTKDTTISHCSRPWSSGEDLKIWRASHSMSPNIARVPPQSSKEHFVHKEPRLDWRKTLHRVSLFSHVS